MNATHTLIAHIVVFAFVAVLVIEALLMWWKAQR